MTTFIATSSSPRFGALTAAALLALSVVAPVSAQSPVSAELQRLLDAPSWQLDCQMTFTASASGARQGLLGPLTYSNTLKREHTASYLIGVRSEGPSLSMQRVMANMAGAGAAEAQKAMLDLISQTGIVSWLSGPPELDENASSEQQLAALQAYMMKPIGTARVDFTQTITGDKLVSESGQPFKQTTRTTRTGNHNVVAGGAQIMLELNASTKRVVFMLPQDYGQEQDAKIAEETVVVTESPPGSAPQETRESREDVYNFPGGVTIADASALNGTALFIDDPLTIAAGKISGGRTVDASYMLDGNAVPGRLVVRYTLTPH